MTDIREQAARAARECYENQPNHVTPDFVRGFESGYLAGYEAAKAEVVAEDPGIEYVKKTIKRLERIARGLP